MFLFVEVADQEWANEQAAALDADGGAETFTVPLSSSGDEPATHFGASSLVRPATRDAILGALIPSRPSAAAYEESDGWTFATAAEDLGLRVIRPEL